jgi:hypothetical protein
MHVLYLNKDYLLVVILNHDNHTFVLEYKMHVLYLNKDYLLVVILNHDNHTFVLEYNVTDPLQTGRKGPYWNILVMSSGYTSLLNENPWFTEVSSINLYIKVFTVYFLLIDQVRFKNRDEVNKRDVCECDG